MDFSSLPEDQRQQLLKLQQLFQEHQLQQQQQQIQQQQEQIQQQQQNQQIQDYSAQGYDPSQVQPYDQSSYYAAYYQYHQQDQQYSQPQPQPQPQQQEQEQQQQQQQQNPHYAYYQADYANAYQQQTQQLETGSHQQQQHSLPESAQSYSSGHQPGQEQGQGHQSHLPPDSVHNHLRGQEQGHHPHLPPESAHNYLPGQEQGKQNAYNPPQQVGQIEDRQNLGYQVPPGLNPAAAAAVAALSQLTQFAGRMEATEKAMAMLVQSGVGTLMSQGQLHQGPGQFGMPVGQSVYGDGVRMGGRPFRGSGHSNFGNRPPGSGGPPFYGRGRGRGRGNSTRLLPNGQSSSSSHPNPSANEVAEPTVDYSGELKQGIAAANKRPPQAFWCELCRVDCTSSEILQQHKNGKKHKKNLERSGQHPDVSSVSETQHEGKSVAEQTLPGNLTTNSVENEVEANQQNDKPKEPEVSVTEDQKHGIKRKAKSRRGGKSIRTFDGSRQLGEPPKPKVVIPIICDLCNVKCDTQEVFDRHLAGKKHILKLKRYEGHQTMFGPLGLQALYPPNPISQILVHSQGPQQGYPGPQGSHPQLGPYMLPQAPHTAPLATGIDSGSQQNASYSMPGPTS